MLTFHAQSVRLKFFLHLKLLLLCYCLVTICCHKDSAYEYEATASLKTRFLGESLQTPGKSTSNPVAELHSRIVKNVAQYKLILHAPEDEVMISKHIE